METKPIDQKDSDSNSDSFQNEINKLDPEISIIGILFYIFKNGIIGFITLALSSSIMAIESLFLGHLPNSKVNISAKENTNILILIMYTMILLFNCGLLIIVSRFIGINDFQSIRHFIKMHFSIVKIQSLIITILVGSYAIAIGWIYDDEVLKWTRIELALTFPIIVMIAYCDSYRIIYIAFDQKYMALLFQFIV